MVVSSYCTVVCHFAVSAPDQQSQLYHCKSALGTMSGNSSQQLEKELLTLEEAKQEMLKRTFSEDKAKKVDEIREKLAKSVFEARKSQLAAQKETYAERKELLKGVENVSRHQGRRAKQP